MPPPAVSRSACSPTAFLAGGKTVGTPVSLAQDAVGSVAAAGVVTASVAVGRKALPVVTRALGKIRVLDSEKTFQRYYRQLLKLERDAATPKPQIHGGKQGKHIPGHNNFQAGKSELTHPDPQALLDRGAGTGVRHGTKEVVDFGEEIGTHVAEDGTRASTSRGTIHYDSKGGAHIVPS